MTPDELITKATEAVHGDVGSWGERAIAKEAARLAYLDAAEMLTGKSSWMNATAQAEALRAKAAEYREPQP